MKFPFRNTKKTGDLGEQRAVLFLQKKGYKILATNWRHAQWELDIICKEEDMLIFVEVKTFGYSTQGSPFDKLTRSKQQKVIKAAQFYLRQNDCWESPSRFDFIAVRGTDTNATVTHIENAFDLTCMGGKILPW